MEYLALFLAVVVGYIVALLFQKKELPQLPIILAFSGAFLLATTLFELLPEVFESSSEHIGVFIMVGILLQIILDFFSKGAEHGHVHMHSDKKTFPLLLFVSLSLHALIEGVPLVDNSAMFYGVLVHKIPIAIILALFFTKAGYKKSTTLSFLLLFAVMTPLGSYLMSSMPPLKVYANEINAVAIGIFLHVSTTILFESSKNHTFNLSKMIAVFIAVIIAYFI
ncbi:ZIP family metal transporter [Rasiella rasia]|uniref:ZIP family metal transporter n=1 Tax=Rasiella rasia TaxID=2744027 RepID=A0A6G6GKV3_9FLAO|nr:ZIP family metal transporter [Rasiella rasia]QIE58321.1 ZIP family metal transporter [Rasiella rasia]